MKKVLVAPLDWGLGHATRCIPVIQELLATGCEVQIATSGAALPLLKEEFPDLIFFELASYQATYSVRLPLKLKILFQLPKFFWVIRKEQAQIKKIISTEKTDILISDNRYGCWSAVIPSVFIGHQFYFDIPFLGKWINRYHERWVRRFSVCWIPDREGDESISGRLSINRLKKTKYIGLLSRMKWKPTETKFNVAVIISGPEPQRSVFEEIIRPQLKDYGKVAILVKGLPGIKTLSQTNQVTEISHLNSVELNEVLLQSEIIICRSGYSSVMDLAVLGKKAIFIPTPGQPEQEYLAERLKKKRIAYSVAQKDFDIENAMTASADYTGFRKYTNDNKLQQVLCEWLETATK
ncbi:MAG: glycosyltransferase [Bacteroidetes bacterium]|nr:glycosyltransferase [Bacteroidota bacterium]